MSCILEYGTNSSSKDISRTNSSSRDKSQTTKVKAKSVPLVHVKESGEILKIQKSAPSYFHSLKDNEAPPFKKPDAEEKPRLLVESLITEEDVIRMIAEVDLVSPGTYRIYLGELLVEKKIILNHQLSEKAFLISLVREAIDYSAQRDFNAHQLACVLTIYLKTHMHFKRSYWTTAASVWEYFKETVIRHTIEDSPDGWAVFEFEYDILTHFHRIYLSNLPLIHILCFGVHRLKFTWPFKS